MKQPQPAPAAKSCEDQHKFAENIHCKLDQAMADIPDGPAKVLLAESKSLVEKRKKLIKIADRHDWQTVKLYTGEDDIAADEEDAKKIRRAETEASKQRNRRTQSQRFSNWRSPYYRSSWRPHQQQNFRPSGSSYRQPVSHARSSTNGGNTRVDPASITCFACGETRPLGQVLP